MSDRFGWKRSEREVAEQIREKIAKEIPRLYGSKSVMEDKIRAIKIDEEAT